VQGDHFEVKLPTEETPLDLDPLPLLDAAQLVAAAPTSFACASCSLPLVQTSRISRYDDLPSEHWAELVDAWMCHTDQKLSTQIAKHGRGFWPEAGQALVGGSYILFDDSVVMKSNMWLADQPKACFLFHRVLYISVSFSDGKKAGVGSLPTAFVFSSRTSHETRSKPMLVSDVFWSMQLAVEDKALFG